MNADPQMPILVVDDYNTMVRISNRGKFPGASIRLQVGA